VKEDFGKSFAVSEQMYTKLFPYIDIQHRDARADSPSHKETDVPLAESRKSAEKPDSLFTFDPNTIDSISLTRLGFSPKQARTILNYRRKGGKFNVKEDFGKSFAVSEQMYTKLFPYIDIRDARTDSPSHKKETDVLLTGVGKLAEKPDSLFAFDPNTVDSVSLTRLGFSPKQARTILNYRRKGGKFNVKEDFRKSFAVSEQMYLKLVPYIDIRH
jgi:DNA uptake protein ComE-like DNA-binding protein